MNKIQLAITADDYYHAQWVHYKLGVCKFIFVTLMSCYLGYFLYSVAGASKFAAIGGVSGWLAWYFGYYLIYLRYRCKKIYCQQKSLNLPAQYEWDNEAIYATNESGSGKIKWSDYVKWRESKQLFLLYQSDVIFNIVPKSSFISLEQINDFSSHLQAIGR